MKAKELKENLKKQYTSLKKDLPVIRLIHEEFPHNGAWTVIPLLPWLIELHGSELSWVLFLLESTEVNVKELVQVLGKYDPKKKMWMGHALHDKESTIIHHFAFSENPTEFKYPLFSSGFVMSMSLIKRLMKKNEGKGKNSDFSIDASHELALSVGEPLLNLADVFCLENREGCATYPTKISSCGKPVPNEEIYFAVKTCLKFHKDRIPVIKKTWGKQAKHIEFFSHLKDNTIPTTDVGVENTERGHCAKMFAIFRLVLEREKDLPSLRWLVLADDDTLLSVTRMQELLSCWNSSEPVAIGEMYGYNVVGLKLVGYNYITGGGSIAISMSALKPILQHCSCQQNDTPDDMYLGICLTRLNIPIVHLSDFHQARPNDYATDYLAVQKPVSFHKHWMIDPLYVYKKWFGEADDLNQHTEL
ncbi:beta-1,3-glucosyltransferase isoform X2 [Lycorma delicatula]